MTGRNDNAGWQTCSLVQGFCDYVIGDGTGDSEEMIGDAASREECVNLVLAERPHANGATYPTTEGYTSCCAFPFLDTESMSLPMLFVPASWRFALRHIHMCRQTCLCTSCVLVNAGLFQQRDSTACFVLLPCLLHHCRR